MEGPGKYDDLATGIREAANADGVILLVIRGNKGNGMSCQFRDPKMVKSIPMALRDLADMIEQDAKQRKDT